MRRIVCLVVGLLAAAVPWSTAVAQSAPDEGPSIRVTEVVGTASWSRGGGTLTVGSSVTPRGRITVAGAGRVTLEMPDGVRLTLGPASVLDLVDPAPLQSHPRTYAVRLVAGGVAIDRDPRTVRRGQRATRVAVRVAAVSVQRGTAYVRVRSRDVATISAIAGPARVEMGAATQFVRTGSALVFAAGGSPTRLPSLPAAPAWTVAPPATILWLDQNSGVSLGVNGLAGATAEAYHVQVSAAESPHDVVDDRVVPVAATLSVQIPRPGHYLVRVASIVAGGVEGRVGEPFSVTAAGPIVRSATAGHAATVEVPEGIFCGLNGARTIATATSMVLSAGRDHVLACSDSPGGATLVRRHIAASESGPMDVQLEWVGAPQAPAGGSRVLWIRLRDATGRPVTLANVRLEPPPGIAVTGVLECEQRGSYSATVSPQHAASAGTLRVVVNSAVTREITIESQPGSLASLDRGSLR